MLSNRKIGFTNLNKTYMYTAPFLEAKSMVLDFVDTVSSNDAGWRSQNEFFGSGFCFQKWRWVMTSRRPTMYAYLNRYTINWIWRHPNFSLWVHMDWKLNNIVDQYNKSFQSIWTVFGPMWSLPIEHSFCKIIPSHIQF